MRKISAFVRNTKGAMAAEFALVLPILIIFLLGIMDVGYYAWAINRGEKATQMGARWAVATDMIPSGLATYSFASQGGISQGTVVPISAFPGVTCTNTGCTCNGSCSFGTTANTAAFDAIVSRMQDFKHNIEPANVEVEYSWSGLGYAGDPNGPDVAPIITVRLVNLEHNPLYGILIGSVDLPDFAYSLTAEDGEGSFSH
ncbi:pilus assembly protein [Qipengyuania sp. 1NDW9]|uniref:TadE/TadG family type IV pilus assembly protein n=1 Tax=Qipengyuania xiapuensis TaxID=2867236 RepID=UPI001C87F4A2|nr:TadE/TadG family type IV pilus assembly protein [Qipengyuania xiapuensis]MBX7494099.1 pilus assembly protein [Qipengyuania xiapuensis]